MNRESAPKCVSYDTVFKTPTVPVSVEDTHGQRFYVAKLSNRLACMNIELAFEIAEATLKRSEKAASGSQNH